MGAELTNPDSPLVVASFYDTVDDPREWYGASDCKHVAGDGYGETWTVNWKRGPVLKGRYRVVSKGSGVWIQEGCEEYVGEVLTDPTWEDLVVEAERQIRCTGDHHHIYLEHVLVAATPTEQLAATQGGLVLDIHLSMGS